MLRPADAPGPKHLPAWPDPAAPFDQLVERFDHSVEPGYRPYFCSL